MGAVPIIRPYYPLLSPMDNGTNMNLFWRRMSPLKKTLVVVASIIILWFVGFDISAFVDKCPRCGRVWYTGELRVFTYPISHGSQMLEEPLYARIAEDLGITCLHTDMKRRHRQRWWGGLICAWPCEFGMIGMTGTFPDDWYDKIAQAVRARAQADPELRKEFEYRVLDQKDWEYFREFRDSLHVAAPVQEDPREEKMVGTGTEVNKETNPGKER